MSEQRKYWVRDKYLNKIKYRALDEYEQRSPQFYTNGSILHDDWDSAFQANIELRKKELELAKRQLKSAERRLAVAKVMVKPAGTP